MPVALKRVDLRNLSGTLELRALDLFTHHIRHGAPHCMHGAWLIDPDGHSVEETSARIVLVHCNGIAIGHY